MPGKPTGQIVEHEAKDGTMTLGLRFRAYGQRHRVALGAVSRGEAEAALRHVLADIERGVWRPLEPAPPPVSADMPTFHQFSEEWWVRNERRFAAKTRTDYRWRLEQHLLVWFGDMPLDHITVASVEDYIAGKLGEEKPLAASTINKMVILLAAILEAACDRDLIGRNPARGRGRRVRERTPTRTYLDTAEQIRALLDAGAALDAKAASNQKHMHRRAILATLVFAGLRIGELTRLRWRDINLGDRWLYVGDAKTDAGRRRIRIRGALLDDLTAIRPADADPDAFVFATRAGRKQNADNLRPRVIGAAVKLASETLVAKDLPPLPERITPHSLRRTFASILYAIGTDPGVVMDEMGHTDPGLALRVYRQAMRRDEGEKRALARLIGDDDRANVGQREARQPRTSRSRRASETQKAR